MLDCRVCCCSFGDGRYLRGAKNAALNEATIPAILGATLLECLKFLKGGENIFLPEGWIVGAVVAFILGMASLRFMKGLVDAGKWAYFGVYCLIVGCVAVAFGMGVI